MKKHRHFILNKPFGYLSQFVNNQNRRKNKKLLGELYDFPEGVMAIGRLDEKSEGLLLLTTDGNESERVRSKEVEKEYYAEVDGEITDEAITKLSQGVEIGFEGKRYVSLPCRVVKLQNSPNLEEIPVQKHRTTSWISITITEGKFRQVRKMTAAVGFPTVRLLRVRIGTIHLNGLKPGEVKEVDAIQLN
ncbi:pseudouridine synthase [Fulvivirga lutea]|uniref:Pseudouridine synthase n=1 Tax=Fulvivirga lutea TaxID=2810512 RepID=A0A974WF19_9BACT|nr:pseudouridine synthase [Fulvivirga lutea]QSE97243.1 pseudouridine synthase [Fulvivirga lutea]